VNDAGKMEEEKRNSKPLAHRFSGNESILAMYMKMKQEAVTMRQPASSIANHCRPAVPTTLQHTKRFVLAYIFRIKFCPI